MNAEKIRWFSKERLPIALMLALTFSTGVSDAVGYLGLDRVFTGNMTGNVVILGMALAGASNLSVLGPLVGLISFFLGAFAAGRMVRSSPAQWTVRSSIAFGAAGLIMSLTAVLIWLQPGSVEEPWSFLMTALLAFSMGTQAGAARHLGVTDINTVVVTSTLIGLAADSKFSSGRGQLWARRILSVALIGLGAVTGSILLQVHLALGVALSAAIIFSVALVGHQSMLSKPSN